MLISIEEIFVKHFIIKPIQDRMIFELSSKKNREKAISRFAHNADEIIDPRYILIKNDKITKKDIEKELNKYLSKDKDVYVISMNETDGKMLTLTDAVRICMEDYMPTIIICNENVAFIKTEVSYGSPMKYILKR